jgi:predicted Fe-Mo cluster-binding NifX family protein
MKIAIPDWQGRVSPVFDVAARLVLAEVEGSQVTGREIVTLNSDGLHARAARIAELGVEVLICGAISWPLELALANAGIEVIPQTCGEVEPVLAAFVADRLDQDTFLMPGCCGQRRRRLGRHRRGRDRIP